MILAHIQSLKKSICKGDKKKKKEVTEEIARLESDLDRRQDEEMSTFKLSQVNINNEENKPEKEADKNDNDDESTKVDYKVTHRISKAQRRREKKEKEEKERKQRIIDQEAENIFGKRNMEMIAIRKFLVKRDLTIFEVPSDGHW